MLPQLTAGRLLRFLLLLLARWALRRLGFREPLRLRAPLPPGARTGRP